MEDGLRAGDVVGGHACDGFGAYGIPGIGIVSIIPLSLVSTHTHEVLALAPIRLTRPPVCERVAVLFHSGVVLRPPADGMKRDFGS